MSLLQSCFEEYEAAKGFNIVQCEIIAKLANITLSFEDTKKPGEVLIKALDRAGYSITQYRKLVALSQNVKTIVTYYKPQTKVAILIANDKYEHLMKLVTPSVDCDSLAANLKNLGFIIVTLKNTVSRSLKHILSTIFDLIPEDSYCFIFYAGHGCEISNTKCMLGVECPDEDLSMDHCVTENYVLKQVAKCKPDLCVFIMDMCRKFLERESNPKIFSSISEVDTYNIHKNLLIGYATQSSEAAYEVFQIECSTTIDVNQTYERRPGDTDKIVPGASQYVNALCTRLSDDLDISSLMDKVHGDVEHSLKKQRPIKLQCGVAKRSLYDPVQGDTKKLLNQLKEVSKQYEENCLVF